MFHILVQYTILAVAAATAAAYTTVEAAAAAAAEAAIDLLWLYCFSPHIPTTALRHPYPIYQLRRTTAQNLVLGADPAHNWGQRG